MSRLIALILLLAATFAPPLTQTSLASTVVGSGTESCGAWLYNREQGGSADQQWVLGYMSGVGAADQNLGDPLSLTDAQGVWHWLDGYCRSHPTLQLYDATFRLMLDLHLRYMK